MFKFDMNEIAFKQVYKWSDYINYLMFKFDMNKILFKQVHEWNDCIYIFWPLMIKGIRNKMYDKFVITKK